MAGEVGGISPYQDLRMLCHSTTKPPVKKNKIEWKNKKQAYKNKFVSLTSILIWKASA